MCLLRCADETYPLDPSLCDRWCRVQLRAGCDEEPENCVRNCERSRAPAGCTAPEGELLGCYERAAPSDFACSEQGFLTIARPEVWVCQKERDALIECAHPEVKACLDLCRVFAASYAAGIEPDASAPERRVCPVRDVPCDSLCWIVRGYTPPPVPDAGSPSDADLPDTGEPDAGADAGPVDGGPSLDAGVLDPRFIALFECMVRRADACYAGEPLVDGGSPDAGANWASSLFECAGEVGL